ncbi:diguanylate cyclase [Alteromonas oceanisediminis]|uniref:diguanylate cyclase n=1 Tax=Alteromonas oceanisediminis TaxID=2836180 RepID=UPI001BDB3D68|nr:diguanylate cyclase [Alteromonas oceanisediminis]MBT0586626.1 GGDEF domain-containing protein [Alteromonas oceanisediminis]
MASNQKNNYAIEIKNPSKYMTLTYAISLTVIAILSGIVHLVLDQVIEQQSQTGRIVNMSGQQRMLSQRASLFTLHYVNSGSVESKQIALEAIDRMLLNQRTLLQKVTGDEEPSLSRELNALYFEQPHNVQQNVVKFSETIRETLNKPPVSVSGLEGFSDSYITDYSKSALLTGLDNVVKQYEKESLERVNDLRFAQNVVFWIIIFTIMVEAFFIFRPMVARMSDFATRLQRDANFDALTNVLNRRAFNILAKQNFQLSKRHNHIFSVMMCDIDYFKRVNDSYGHATGDEVIKSVASQLSSLTRSSDIVARFGGEEFVIILPNTPQEEALRVAEKIRQQVESHVIDSEEDQLMVTISIGVSAVAPDDSNVEPVIARADDALYLAKNAGRNRVEAHESTD